jgi:hypothetical protein
VSVPRNALVAELTRRKPPDEAVLWVGAPVATALARRAFRTRTIMLYFGIVVAWRIGSGFADQQANSEIAAATATLVGFALAVVALCHVYARLVRRSTCYLLTEKRLVMRIGAVVPVTINLPLAQIETARFKDHGDGTGNIALVLAGETRLAWFMLWPHARPWRITKPEPLLRSIPDAAAVATLLARLLGEVHAATRPSVQAEPSPLLAEDRCDASLAA